MPSFTFSIMPDSLNILFVDDDADRYRAFARKKRPQDRLVYVETVESALDMLRSEVFDIVFLDHDLGEGNLEGKDLVKYICAQQMPLDCIFIIHSMNSVGGMNMKNMLSDCGYTALYWSGAWKKSYGVKDSSFYFGGIQ